MTTDLDVRCLAVSYRMERPSAETAARLDGVLGRVARRGLERGLERVRIPAGEWCVRRLDVPVQLSLTRTDRTLEDEWVVSLVESIASALDSPGREVVHYPTIRHALVDLVSHMARGSTDRLWAWKRLGLLGRDRERIVDSRCATIESALLRHPELALGVIVEVASTIGLAALDHALEAAGWSAVARIIAGRIAPDAPDVGAMSAVTDVSIAPSSASVPRAHGRRELAESVLRSSVFAALVRDARIRADERRRFVWAIIAMADADPSLLARTDAPSIVAAVARRLFPVIGPWSVSDQAADLNPSRERQASDPQHGQLSTASVTVGDTSTSETDECSAVVPPTVRRPGAQPDAVTVDDAATADRRTAQRRADFAGVAGSRPSPRPTQRADDQPEAAVPSPHQQVVEERTKWAGLPFLLNTAAALGLAEATEREAALAARPLRWLIHRLASVLVPVDPQDPAALALAGLLPGQDPLCGSLTPATPAEVRAIARLAEDWARQTAVALDRDSDDPMEVVAWVANRAGFVTGDRGWIEVHLELASVDLTIRRAGLDLNPDWVPWLGCVVRFVYE
jgi:hypothetical protein